MAAKVWLPNVANIINRSKLHSHISTRPTWTFSDKLGKEKERKRINYKLEELEKHAPSPLKTQGFFT